MRKKSECFGVEKEASCRKRRGSQPTNSRYYRRHITIASMWAGKRWRSPAVSSVRRDATTIFSLELDELSFNAPICANLIEEQVARTIRRA